MFFERGGVTLYNQVDISETSVIDRLWFQGSMVVLVTSQNINPKTTMYQQSGLYSGVVLFKN